MIFLYISSMAIWISTFLTILVVYIVISVLLYYLQDYLLFKPEKLPKDFQFYYENQVIEEYNLETRDGAIINGLHFKVENPRGVVLYLKGNSKSIKGWGKFARDFVGKGYDFFMIDYRGFGKSRGKRTESILYNDTQHVYKWLKTQ